MKRGFVLLTAACFALGLAAPLDEAEGYRSPFKGGKSGLKSKGERGGHRARKLFERVELAYLAGDTHQVLAEGGEFLEKYPRNKRADRVLHTMALASLEKEDPARARQDLIRLKSLYPSSGLADRTDLTLGESFFMEGNTGEAIRVWKQALVEYPGTSYRVLYLDRLAQAHKKEGRFQEARRIMEEIRTRYPESLEAREASKTLAANGLYFTVQVGSFSSRANAKKLIRELEGIGMEPRLSEGADGRRTFYRVRVGRYDTKAEAEGVASRLRRKGYLTKIYP